VQKISLTGACGSPVSCLLRYRLIEGPTNVDVQSSLGGQATVVTDLRPVSKIPANSRFTQPERSNITLSFSPNMPVDCTFSPNITSGVTDNSTNKTFVTLLVVGLSTANCVPRDPTYAPLDPFTIEATPLKRFTIVPKVANMFVGTDVDVDFYVSSAPAGGTMTVRPNMTLLGPYVTAKPGIILFTSVSALQARIAFTGLALTPGPIAVPLIVTGPATEFLLDSAATSLTVSVLAPINLTYTPSALMTQTRIGDTFTSYVGTDNSMLWTFEITGVPLTGAIKVILTCDNVLVSFSDSVLQYGDHDALRPAGLQGIMKFIFAAGFWRNPEDIYWVPRFGMLDGIVPCSASSTA
jgi:hypothetical protein